MAFVEGFDRSVKVLSLTGLGFILPQGSLLFSYVTNIIK